MVVDGGRRADTAPVALDFLQPDRKLLGAGPFTLQLRKDAGDREKSQQQPVRQCLAGGEQQLVRSFHLLCNQLFEDRNGRKKPLDPDHLCHLAGRARERWQTRLTCTQLLGQAGRQRHELGGRG